MKKVLLLSLILIAILACDSSLSSKVIKTSSLGKINSVLVVIDNDKWQGKVGDVVRDVFAKSLIGFPQEEPRFNLSQVSKYNLKKLLKQNRTIVSIEFGAKNTFSITKDKYATPQRIIAIVAKNKADLKVLLQENEREIINAINESDIKTSQKLLLQKYWDHKTINTFKNLGVHIKIPYAYLKVQDTLNYIWFRKDIAEGYLNLQLYAVDIDSEADFTEENIIKFRNQKGKAFIPGTKENMYMITEEAFTPIQIKTKMLNKTTIETRGTWEMKNGFMAGPFLNYALLDKKHHRIIIAEGFVYAPNIKKRDYLFELESLLKTLEFDE